MKIRRFLVWCLFYLLPGLGTSEYCSPSDSESVLHINNAYTYHFRSVALAQAVGTTEDRSKILLECDAHIFHDRTCYYHLKLEGCEITASGGEPGSEAAWMDKQSLPDLSRHHVTFSLSNGEVGEVKAHEEDPLYYLNIKRGVLSAFVFKLSQTKDEMKEMHTDIHGTCPLTSVPDKEVNGEVRTSKDMLHCNFPSRPDWQFSPWSLFWNMSFIQHVINSTTDCNYKISTKEKRIETVFCEERHAIMLESTHYTTTAVQTNIYYYLDFVKLNVQNSKSAFAVLTRSTDIRYEYDHTPLPVTSPSDFLPVAVKMLSDLVMDSVDEVRLFTITQFTDFIAWIRASHDLTSLVDKVKYCEFLPDGVQCDDKMKELALSYLSDALVQCNNLPCAKAIAYLAKNDDLSPTYLNFIYQSWSYMHYSKPGFLTNFVDICKEKDSRQCWMSAAAFARRIYSRNGILNQKVLQEIKDLASYFHNHIEEDCEVTDDADSSHYTSCLIYLKAASNFGEHYGKLVPDGISRFLEHATNDHSPTFVRTSSLEAIHEVYYPDNKAQNREIYDELLPLLKNATLSPTLRILSYDILLPLAEEHPSLADHLIGIVRDEKNADVKLYIADSLNKQLNDHQIKTKNAKFLDSVAELLIDNTMSLENIIYNMKAKSKKSTHSAFLNLDFLPESMRRFGLKVAESTLYDSYIYPTVLNQETVLQLFSTFLPANKLRSYFEGWEELLLAYKKNLADMNSQPATFSKIYEAIAKTLEEYGSDEQNEDLHFDGNIIANIRRIHHLYWQHHKKLNPYAKAYLDLFGSTIKYMVQDSFKQSSVNKDLAKLMRFMRKDLKDGVTYSTTRVVRVIEAYHQVPTMMGLPLNWTTNATVAFSFRAGLKYQYNILEDQIHSKAFFQPSAALTFLNRMVLDFPTLTQIGVQANSSGYTSTEFKLQYTSSKGKQSFRIERPSRTQKVLELFRTNQLIKHNSYSDILDWDIERTSSSWCTKDNSQSMAGLKLCLSKSYPNVTHRIKPWALMAGWCKWQFLVHPVDQNEMHYDFQFQQVPKQKSMEYKAKLSATEREKEKAMHFNAMVDENGRVELKTSLLPDFRASFSRSEITKNKKDSGHKINAFLQIFKDFKYEMEYSNECKVQKTQMSSTKTGTSKESNQIQINEEKFFLTTPSCTHRFNKAIEKKGEDTKVDASFHYENLNSKNNWLRTILPPPFWEDDKKASALILLKWKAPNYQSEDTTIRQTEFRIIIPQYTMTLLGDSLEMNNREQINVNVAKINTKLDKLETFLNFTYDVWESDSGDDSRKELRQVNITIPRRSWSATFVTTKEESKYKYEVKLRRSLMKPREEQYNDYVGWWSDEVSDNFGIEEKEVQLILEFEMLSLTAEDLLVKYSDTVTHEEMLGLGSIVIPSKVALHYPYSDRVETLVFDGFFIISKGMTTFRFQKTFDMIGSYNNLKLTSHTVYKTDMDATRLHHHSYFTHLTSQTKAYNTINYTRFQPEGGCDQYFFKHDIRSHVFDLSTDASYKCEADNLDLYTLLLTLNTNSSKWDMLNLKLNQIIQAVSPDYIREDVTATHPLGTLHVDAEWHGKRKRREHQKRVVVCSKEGNCPNTEMFLETFPDGRVNLKLSWPNQNDSQLTFERLMSRDHKNLEIKLGHSNKENNITEFLDLSGEIIAQNFHVWKGMVNVDTYVKVKELVVPAYYSVRDTVMAVAKDKNHPLNEILQPALKTTLYDYWNSVETEVKEYFSVSWSEAMELLYIVKAFADPAYDALSNIAVGVCDVFTRGYNAIKDKSVAIWAIHYFELPHYFKQGFMHLPQGIKELMKQLALQEKSVLHFKFITGKIMSWSSFTEWPSISFYPSWLSNLLYPSTHYGVAPFSTHLEEGEKLAMIFGPLHIWTFDGRLFDVPKYPHKDCAFLLAHDVHKSLFTVISSQRSLDIIFPEMSITIDDHNEVFINGSEKASSLPMQASNGKVTIKREHVVEVWSPSLSVICSDRHFLCILKLRKFHTGGVIGLLGNADGYEDNEFMLPNGNTTSSLVEYASIYEISGKPECKNLVSSPKISSSDDQWKTCSDSFGNVCYSRYETRQRFLEACISDVQAGHDPCYTAAGLAAMCHFQYSPSYTRCNTKRQTSERVGRNLEVVLVVQESKHLTSQEQSNAPIKGIESLIRALDDKFRSNGYDTVLYSLVGFGGHGVHCEPAVHSARKDMWLTADDAVNDVLKTLEFKSKEDADSTRALKYALDKLGYDSFDSKVIIVITNKDRQGADKSLTDAIKSQLENNGITLYTISSYPSIEKGKKVYGVRTDGLIFPSPKDADAYMDYPRGSLAKLTSSTRGSLFLSKFLRDNKPSAFFDEIAQEVWAKVNKEPQKCRSCRSTKGDWWWYRNECTIEKC